ncbi:GNAT family N-acetyltransferase [Cognatishimia sp. SS12]|uniref:GNAT family N-acetyltransferase n=1 Tax=Cognatishimia sp. SS12 TaxID=2979465 RepID=UPI00232F658A|nr:GNAT family N-acetyltransferase [Cognatishimia sp. SS12]MDC0737587.1 GNAT family N-acetyltransferase [Cognatishimia sp. SS12]
MRDTAITIEVHPSLKGIPASDWDACADPAARAGQRPLDPFTTHRFLLALEDSGSVGPGTGWQPQYLAAYTEHQLIACAPLYAKGHSQGEYIFDHNWAHAYENAGGRYYPKLQIAVPFTPATGRRFLVRPGFEDIGMAALMQGAVEIANRNQLSSLHATFCTAAEVETGASLGLMHRRGQQFHWTNADYPNFDAFLASLNSRKRKTIRKERARAQRFGGELRHYTGDQIQPEHWDAIWTFYQDTGSRKWGSPYLTRAFFDIMHETMRDDILLVLAERHGSPIAGAMNFIGRDTLFGRYWGCIEHHDCLHFEVCYYQAMDWAIAHGLAKVEAGAQGEHKLARGYLPAETHSLHWIADPGFAEAIDRYLVAEREAVSEEIEVMTRFGPFRNEHREEQE